MRMLDFLRVLLIVLILVACVFVGYLSGAYIGHGKHGYFNVTNIVLFLSSAVVVILLAVLRSRKRGGR